ncbi:hypothetical protein FDP41_009596 [Naegleria fowleri]|uniref:Uncharacterized protein n=2 Tax=Naegleria fowleri TaxID=5763 RepID=A0A6A5BCU3_NAEFO|nr:uncharacterized protein FDP41_009596 [Naegleria fowleri]KAF0971900.1 hypothetical protein FDP41_009596 [Naegleria fowleri]
MARTKQTARKSTEAAQVMTKVQPKRKAEFESEVNHSSSTGVGSTSSNSSYIVPPYKSLKTICIPYEREYQDQTTNTSSDYHQSLFGCLSELPNEIFQHILTFLVGDFELYKKIDVTKIDPNADKEQRNRYKRSYLSSDIESFLIPYENLVALVKLMQTNKELNRMITSKRDDDHLTDFELFWLNGYNFFEKLFYWIRTRTLETLKLGTGDLSRTAVEEMGRIQNIVQHYERGKSLSDLDATIDHNNWFEDEYANDEEQYDEFLSDNVGDDKKSKKKVPIFNNAEASRKAILERLHALELSIEDYCHEYRSYTSAFELFFFRSLMLSLNMFDALDSESRQEYWSDNSESLLGYHYFDHYSKKAISEPSDWARKVPYNPNVKYPKVGLMVYQQSGWKKLLCNNNITTDSQTDQNSELKEEDIDFNFLRNRLSKIILLQISLIPNLLPLEDYEFPENIMFLSVEQGNDSKTTATQEYSFDGATFPGVRYLRVRYNDDDYRNYGKNLGIQEVIILRSLLNKKTLPKLEHLVLNGFSTITTLEEQFDFLKQLISIEITFNQHGYGADQDIWEKATEFTSRLSQASSKLRYVVVHTDLDSRRHCRHDQLAAFYKSHRCPVSIGYASISRFYYISGE